MAEKDLVSKKIEDYNEVFADIYNTLLFQSPVINPDWLKASPTESIYKTDNKDLNSQSRDILKKYHDETHLVISSFGIENQASIDKKMPIRIMGYDAGTYHQQLKDRESEITPVITIVLNMADKKWDAPKSIHEMLKTDEKLVKYVQNYKIHVFDIAFLEDDTIESFTSDFREIARFFKKKRLGDNPFTSQMELAHPEEIIEFISVFTQDKRYLDGIPYIENVKKEGGAVTMCAVADALISEGIRKGKLEGIREGIREGKLEGKLEGKIELLHEMNYSISEIASRLGISDEQVKKILQK